MRTTSSSTSSSESSGPAERPSAEPWRAFSVRLLATALVATLVLLAVAAALDPYDTGRFALVRTPGVLEQGPRTANASRARDPAFRGLIIGNSHIQLVRPAALQEATGIPFVSLIVPATSPKEQFALLDYALRRRSEPPEALVIGTDDYWCTGEAEGGHRQPFPFWLYDPSPLAYLLGLLRDSTFDALVRRVQYVSGWSGRPRARPDGYWSYEEHRTWDAARTGADLARPQPSPFVGSGDRFPRIEQLGARLAALPAETAVVLVRPPVYVTALPRPGTPLAAAEAACRRALAELAARRPRTILVDWRLDRPETREPRHFFDGTHYRGPLARALEADIAAALTRAAARPAEAAGGAPIRP